MPTLKKLLSLPIIIAICIFTRIDSSYATNYPFSVTSTNMSSGDEVFFYLSAQGIFTVDCGTGGTLHGGANDGGFYGVVSGNTIDRSSTAENDIYWCTYSSGGVKTIGFDGEATMYNDWNPAIAFYDQTNLNIASISGDLSIIFPQLSNDPDDLTLIPNFWMAFGELSNLTSVSNSLFSGYTTGIEYMFYETFKNCSSLTTIPSNLFSNITVAGLYTFNSTFDGCSNLSGYVPSTLFAGLVANGSQYDASQDTMENIFLDTGLATTCSAGTTQYIIGYEDYWNSKVSCGVPITCSSGTYLPARTTTCAACPSGFACSGGTFGFHYNIDQGKEAVSSTVNLTWYDGNSTITGPSSCTVGGTFLPPTPAPRPGYIFTGWKIKPSCAAQIQALTAGVEGIGAGSQSGYTDYWGRVFSLNTEDYGITTDNTWAAEFPFGTVWGKSRCSTTSGNNYDFTWPSNSQSDFIKTPADNSGTNCWCQATGFMASGNSYTSGPQCTATVSNVWVFEHDLASYGGDAIDCEADCAYNCSIQVLDPDLAGFQAAVFGTAGQ